MVPTIRSAPAVNTLPEPANIEHDSDLDEYHPKDNLESYRASEFQPPLSDLDVLIADNMVPAPGTSMGTAPSHSVQASEHPTEEDINTTCTTENPLGSFSPVGTLGPLTILKVAEGDSLTHLPTLPTFPLDQPLDSPSYTDKELLEGTLSPIEGPPIQISILRDTPTVPPIAGNSPTIADKGSPTPPKGVAPNPPTTRFVLYLQPSAESPNNRQG